MLFNSPVFLFAFLPVTLALYLVFERYAHAGMSIGFLVLASLFFYSWWNPLYLPLLLGSICFNFTLGLLVAPGSGVKARRAWLIAGIAADIILLGVFKYADFAASTFDQLTGNQSGAFNIILPLAIRLRFVDLTDKVPDSLFGNSDHTLDTARPLVTRLLLEACFGEPHARSAEGCQG